MASNFINEHRVHRDKTNGDNVSAIQLLNKALKEVKYSGLAVNHTEDA
jgi:hypothetical protein